MPRNSPDPVADLRSRLKRCGRRIAAHVTALNGDDDNEGLYAERAALYEEGLELKVKQVDLAEWAGSNPEAVADVLRKRRAAGG